MRCSVLMRQTEGDKNMINNETQKNLELLEQIKRLNKSGVQLGDACKQVGMSMGTYKYYRYQKVKNLEKRSAKRNSQPASDVSNDMLLSQKVDVLRAKGMTSNVACKEVGISSSKYQYYKYKKQNRKTSKKSKEFFVPAPTTINNNVPGVSRINNPVLFVYGDAAVIEKLLQASGMLQS